ncbi:unnamed protein product [Cuscuta campestris]|uniref:Uncharacterized protein n=1 Tax=Cuscuta campestris TaxID=132261 RepID=A0A484LGP2_9ASTE|nr:unnamed protein product [Cuscuta campestris]
MEGGISSCWSILLRSLYDITFWTRISSMWLSYESLDILSCPSFFALNLVRHQWLIMMIDIILSLTFLQVKIPLDISNVVYQ